MLIKVVCILKIEWLFDLRKKNHLSQQLVAKKIGISTQYYNFIENNRRRPSPAVAKRIAAVLGFSDEWYRLLEPQTDVVSVAEK